jgi:hypothetical protein
MSCQIPQQPAQGAELLELREDEPHHRLHLLIGVELDGVVGIPDIANGQRKAECPSAGFAQAALVEPLLEQMQLRFTHGAFES